MYFLKQDQLREWLAAAQKVRTLIAPVHEGDFSAYQPVADVDAIMFDFGRTRLSAKEHFLPATERLLTIERREGAPGEDGSATPWTATVEDHLPDQPQVFFGLHPCDARGLVALDALLLQAPVDAYYARRRALSVLVGLSCQDMGEECFCTAVGSSPDDPQGLDVLLTPLSGGEGYLVDVLTDKGAQLWQLSADQTPFVGDRPAREWPAPAFSVPDRQGWEGTFNSVYWSRLSDRCLSCRACAYVCPTCRCFDIRDDKVAQGPGFQQIERIRCWDSCMGEGYRRIAGGHNPRAAKEQRVRNRFFCKFDYYPADFGPVACVGCGRCIAACPVNVDITEVVAAVQALAESR
jgi:sulfhydrogenase subunit beta (sulfur reductase)